MKVILTTDVKNLGQRGEEKEVKPGFARNFLFPKNLAVAVGSPEAKKLIAEVESKRQASRQLEESLEHKLAEIADQHLFIKRKATAKGKLYAGLDQEEVRQIIEDNFNLAPKKIIANLPIKTLGEHAIILEFAKSKKLEIKLVVTAETG